MSNNDVKNSVSFRNFFERLSNNPNYDCVEGKMQSMIYFYENGRRRKVGGYNGKHFHWYLSKKFVVSDEDITQVKLQGFRFIEQPHNSHKYWRLDDINAVNAVESAITKITGIPI